VGGAGRPGCNTQNVTSDGGVQTGTALTRALAAALGSELAGLKRVHGGDTARAFRVRTADGRTVFAKTHDGAPPGFFTTEAAGLRWLREPRVIAVPEVLAVSDGDAAAAEPNYLVLEWVDRGPVRGRTEADLGRAIAALHARGAPSFGRDDRRTTGSRGLPNNPCGTWAEFYATQRLLPLAAIARDTGALPDRAVADLERLAGRLEEVGGPPEPPARLHGDLWAGNRIVDAGGASWLIDPAAHGGHREFDLAMMRLFGGFGPECFAAYEEATPLAPGSADRVGLHQVAPLVVHAVKFGGSYVDAAARAIRIYT
jgi:fructosamine-3-kinase